MMSLEAVPVSRHKVIAVVLFQSLSAISVTMASKASLLQVPSPLALLTCQTLVQTVLLGIVGLSYGHVVLFESSNVSK